MSDPEMLAIIERDWGYALPASYGERVAAMIENGFCQSLRAITGVAAVLDWLEPPVCVASSSAPIVGESGGNAVEVAAAGQDRRHARIAEPSGRFDHCVQHRLHIGGGAADDVEHVASRGLILERFFEVARALAQDLGQE